MLRCCWNSPRRARAQCTHEQQRYESSRHHSVWIESYVCYASSTPGWRCARQGRAVRGGRVSRVIMKRKNKWWWNTLCCLFICRPTIDVIHLQFHYFNHLYDQNRWIVVSCSIRAARSAAEVLAASPQIVQSLTNWVERMRLLLSHGLSPMQCLSNPMTLLLYILTLHKIVNVFCVCL